MVLERRSFEWTFDETLRFVTGDGRTIPRCGYRLEDFVDEVDDGARDAEDASPSREGFCTTTVQRCVVRGEVREPAAIYRSRHSAIG